jgi:hypothetical protein
MLRVIQHQVERAADLTSNVAELLGERQTVPTTARDVTIQLGVACAPHLPHAAFADLGVSHGRLV